MLLALGLATYGAARLFSHRGGGLVLFGVGTAASAMVRPHVALMLLAAIAVAYLVRRNIGARPGFSVRKSLGLLAFAAIGVFLAVQFQRQFDLQHLDSDVAGQLLDQVQQRSSLGGSVFTPVPLTSPLGIPMAFVTVLFRPLPIDVHSSLALIASLEGVLLAVLFVWSLPRLRPLLKGRRMPPFVLLATVYSGLFILAFARISNFGILVRERSQVFPFFFALLSLRREPARAGQAPPRPKEGPPASMDHTG